MIDGGKVKAESFEGIDGDVAAAMAHLVEELDYSNFKDEVARVQGHERAHRYHDVWAALYPLQKS